MVLILHTLKMPHSNFKERSHLLNSRVIECPCGQTFDYTSERNRKLEFWLHGKFCCKLEGIERVRVPKKAMMPREQQFMIFERMRKVHENY